jgi:hypothetical protein
MNGLSKNVAANVNNFKRINAFGTLYGTFICYSSTRYPEEWVRESQNAVGALQPRSLLTLFVFSESFLSTLFLSQADCP